MTKFKIGDKVRVKNWARVPDCEHNGKEGKITHRDGEFLVVATDVEDNLYFYPSELELYKVHEAEEDLYILVRPDCDEIASYEDSLEDAKKMQEVLNKCNVKTILYKKVD